MPPAAPATDARERRLATVLLLSVMLQWGLAFVGIRTLVEHVSTVTVTVVRFTIACLAMGAILLLTKTRLPRVRREDRLRILVMSVLVVIAYHLALNYGERFVSAGVASLIVASAPVLVAILSAVVLHERVGPVKAAGIATALAGVVLLMIAGTGSLHVDGAVGAVVTAIAPLSFAVTTILAKPVVPRYGALPITATTLFLGTAILLLFGLPLSWHQIPELDGGDWAWLLFLGVGCTAFGYYGYYRALAVLDASVVGAWLYVVPLCSVLWGALLLDEDVTALSVVGGLLVLGGVVATERLAPRVERSRTL
jgi:drug/metabolite transporter (DMT)-like permease